MQNNQKIAVCLWFDGQAEEAAEFYTSVIPDSEITHIMRMADDQPAIMVTFILGGFPFQALNGGPQFQPTEAASISISTKGQEETDRFWNTLIADGGSEHNCAWLKDKFGVSWQIVPTVLPEYLGSSDREAAGRAMQAMMGMNKIVISELEAAFNGGCD